MATPDIYWPRDVLSPRQVTPELVPATISGGRTITSVEKIIKVDAGYWQITLDQIPYASKEHKRAWRAVAGILQGRFGTIAVPVYDTDGAPWPLDGNGNPITDYPDEPHSDGTLFSDGTGYDQPVIVAEIYANAGLGAVYVTILFTFGDADGPQPGQFFSVANRLYRIIGVTASAASPTQVFTCKITPPLREPIFLGDTAEFDDPRCICCMATDTEMMSAADAYNGTSTGKVTFVEKINVDE